MIGRGIKAMKPETLTALQESIEHWKRLSAGNTKSGETTGPKHCALCNEFINKNDVCNGCPIMNVTGMDGCSGTPYRNAEAKMKMYGQRSPEFKTAAKEELAFLESLLP